jgi:apolipoprotein N-acyltransferase
MNNKIRYALLAISAFSFLFCAWKMYQLALEEQLWGYWTLGLLTTAWATWLLASLRLYIVGDSFRWLRLSLLSGVCFVMGFPNSPLTFMMFVAFVPLLIIVKEIGESQINNKKRQMMRYFYNAFVIWNIGSTWWVANAGLVPGLIANLLNAFFMCLPVLLYYVIKQRVAAKIAYVGFICFWLSWEILHLNWELSWPWLTLGNAFAQYPMVVQWYEFTGVMGGGFWILLINVLATHVIINYKDHYNKKLLVVIAMSLVLPLLFSVLLYINAKSTVLKDSISVSVIQPNYEPHYEKFKIPDEVQLERFLVLSLKALNDNPTMDYLIFPETSFGYFDVDRMNEYPVIEKLNQLNDSFPNLHIITGLDLFKMYAPSENLPKSVRKTKRGLMEIYNGAVQLTQSQDSIPVYKKGKMVPGAEIFPFRFLFSFLEPLFNRFNGTVEGLGTQAERSVFTSKNGSIAVAPLICYESIYGDYCRGYVHKGANALFIMTNDGWWDDTPGYMQHLKFATLRAIELRRDIARSANTGSSAFINHCGNITEATSYNGALYLNASVGLSNGVTFYAKYGDYIAWIAVFLGAVILIYYGKKLIKA